MGRGQAFVDVLDGMLDGYESHAAAAPRLDMRVATPSLFILRETRPVVAATRRPRRILSMKQQDALDTLLDLGARLDRDFTDDELRRTFRALAMRYHPDRHINADEQERTRLAVLFTRAHAAYEILKAAPPKTLH
jgi:DnaJ-domain-containing protein 1